MQKKVLKFLFPIPTISLTVFMFLIFLWYTTSEKTGTIIDVLGMTLVFFVICMVPLDIMIWLIKTIINRTPQDTNKPPTENQPNNKPIDQTIKNSDAEEKANIDLSAPEECSHSLSNAVISEPTNNSLNTIAKVIMSVYESFGIGITMSKASVSKNYVIYKIVPLSGTRVKSVLRLQDDVSTRLGVDVEIELRSKLGCIEIIIPKNYFFNIPEEIKHSDSSNKISLDGQTTVYNTQDIPQSLAVTNNTMTSLCEDTTEKRINELKGVCYDLGKNIESFINDYTDYNVELCDMEKQGKTLTIYYHCSEKISRSYLDNLENLLMHGTGKKIDISLENANLSIRITLI